jgi:hypothetical protein
MRGADAATPAPSAKGSGRQVSSLGKLDTARPIISDRISQAGRRRRPRPGGGPAVVLPWLRGSADFDRAIVTVWRRHLAGIIDFDVAGRLHDQLVAARDGREAVR